MSTVRVVDGCSTSLTADATTPRTASWRALYCLIGLASLGNYLEHGGVSGFSCRVYMLGSPSFSKLELCGSMSTAALRANFISVSGSDWTIEAQIEALFW